MGIHIHNIQNTLKSREVTRAILYISAAITLYTIAATIQGVSWQDTTICIVTAIGVYWLHRSNIISLLILAFGCFYTATINSALTIESLNGSLLIIGALIWIVVYCKATQTDTQINKANTLVNTLGTSLTARHSNRTLGLCLSISMWAFIATQSIVMAGSLIGDTPALAGLISCALINISPWIIITSILFIKEGYYLRIAQQLLLLALMFIGILNSSGDWVGIELYTFIDWAIITTFTLLSYIHSQPKP